MFLGRFWRHLDGIFSRVTLRTVALYPKIPKYNTDNILEQYESFRHVLGELDVVHPLHGPELRLLQQRHHVQVSRLLDILTSGNFQNEKAAAFTQPLEQITVQVTQVLC